MSGQLCQAFNTEELILKTFDYETLVGKFNVYLLAGHRERVEQ